jgi:hypothetical protein
MTLHKNSSCGSHTVHVDRHMDITRLVVATYFANMCGKTEIKALQMGLWCITVRTERTLETPKILTLMFTHLHPKIPK